MKTLKQIKRQEPTFQIKQSLKRSKKCKFNEGKHSFEKVIPRFLFNFGKYKGITDVTEFYELFNKSRIGYLDRFECFYYKCSFCGKQRYELIKK